MTPYAGTAIERRLRAEGRLTGTVASPDYGFDDPRTKLFQLFATQTFHHRNFDDDGLVELLRFAKFDAFVARRLLGEDNAAYADAVHDLIRRSNESALDALSPAFSAGRLLWKNASPSMNGSPNCKQNIPDASSAAQAPILDGKTALDKLDRAVRQLGLHGVTITSQVQGLPLDSPQLEDSYAKVNELDVPIFVHPVMVPKGYDLVKDYDLGRILGREMDLALATTRIIAGGILERFPNLKFVIGHFGGGIASVKDRLVATAYRFGTLKRSFDDYVSCWKT